jgi:hypothetical protein
VFHHLLLYLDDPDDARTLLPHLRRIARTHRSRVSVMQSVSFLGTLVQMPGELSPDLHGEDVTAEAFVAALVEHLRTDGFSTEGFTDVGRNALTLSAAAQRIDASLILLSLRRRSLIEQMFRVCPAPMLSIPLERRRRSPQVLVPIEDETSLQVIPHAAGMARILRAGITFVAAENQDLLPRARELAERELVSTEVTLVADDLASTLLELSGSLIVMKSPALDVAARLVRESRIPLLVLGQPPPLPPNLLAPKPVTVPERLPPLRRVPRNPLEGIGEP